MIQFFAFWGKKVFNRYQKDTKPIKSAIRKKKQEDLEKALHLEVLNDHKADIVSVLKKIFNSNQWLVRYNIKCKLTHYLDYFYGKKNLVRNANLLLKYS